MKYYIILIISLFTLGCQGEREFETAIQETVKPIIEEVEGISFLDGPNLIDISKKMIKPEVKIKTIPKIIEKECPKIPVKKKLKPTYIPNIVRKFNKAARIKDGYKLSGHYVTGECRGKIYERVFLNSSFLFFVDCRNNFTTQRVRK